MFERSLHEMEAALPSWSRWGTYCSSAENRAIPLCCGGIGSTSAYRLHSRRQRDRSVWQLCRWRRSTTAENTKVIARDRRSAPEYLLELLHPLGRRLPPFTTRRGAHLCEHEREGGRGLLSVLVIEIHSVAHKRADQ
jgi:hypothetical protein